MADLTQRNKRTSLLSGFRWKQISIVMMQFILIAALVIGPGTGRAWAAEEISRLVLSKNALSLSVGDSFSLTATAINVNGSTSDVTIKAIWNADANNPDVASVYAGNIVAKKEGTAYITATYLGKTEVVTVNVHKKVRSLDKNKQSLSKRVGQFEQITLEATYTDGQVEDVTSKAEWRTESDLVASVVNGKVTAVGSGKTNVIATYGGKTVTVPVSVDIVRRLDPSVESIDLRVGGTDDVKLMAMFENGDTDDVAALAEWTSSNGSVADIFKGVVTAYGAGQATLTGTYGGKSATIIVNVETVKKLEASKTDLFLKIDGSETITLTAYYADENNTSEVVTAKAEWSSSDESIADVEDGTITANSVGQATITASYGTKTVTITVDAGIARKLEADKTSLSMRKGTEETIKLEAIFASGNAPEDVTGLATWSSSDESVAYVSKGKVRANGSGEATIKAEYGDKSVSIPVQVDTARVLKVTPSTLHVKVGDENTVKLEVTYADGNSEDVTTKAQWSSDKPEVADVINGKITALGTGQAAITGSFGEKTAVVTVNVELAKNLTLSKSDIFLKVGGTDNLTLKATFADGGASVDVTNLAEWSSDNADVADVVDGQIRAYKVGQATISATYGSKTVTAAVDVGIARKLELDKKSLSLRKGETAPKLELKAYYANGTSEIITDSAEWSSEDQAVAVLESKGVVKAISSGETKVTAKYGDKIITIPVSVDPASKLEADKVKVELQPGYTAEIKLTATYEDNNTEDVTSKAEWISSNESIATADDGIIRAVDRGEAVITAKYGKKTIKITVSVGAMESLTANEKTIYLKEGEGKQILLTTKYKDGTSKDSTSEAAWSSSSSSVAEVSGGYVTAVGSGKSTIMAKVGEKTVTISVQVELADRLTPTHRSVVMRKGDNLQVGLTATYGNGTTEDVTNKAVWSVSSAKVADVYNGLITAFDSGRVTVTAKYGAKVITIPVEIDTAQKLTLNKKSAELRSGQNEQLSLTATFSDGSTRDVTGEAEWTTRSYKIADVNHTGLVSAVSYGKTTITAKYGSKTVSIPIEVDSLKYLKTNVKTIEMKVGETKRVNLTATYRDGLDVDVAGKAEWKSSRDATADVKDGAIMAYAKGTATVTAKFGGKTATLKVIVK
ncbi:Ig domain-containing protein [Paenibacillus sp. GCM10012303]|uniref:Ig-like domain-containing protein n=1 Tax=Paenibacillus sp. GCM10012303 TaxID=3317340 RepID=UPI003606D0CC